MYCKCHRISLARGEWYKDSPDCIKTKKSLINLKNNGDKCFQYAVTAALNHENIIRSNSGTKL